MRIAHVFVLVLILAAELAPDACFAQAGTKWSSGPYDSLSATSQAIEAVTFSALGAVALGFLAADVVTFATRNRYDQGWAVVEIIVSLAPLALGGAYVALSKSGDKALGLGIPTLALGSAMMSHGISVLSGVDAHFQVNSRVPMRAKPVASASGDGFLLGLSAVF